MRKSRHIQTSAKAVRSHWEALGFEFQDGCFACGGADRLERAHIVAASDDGEDTPGNLLIICRNCHRGPYCMPDQWGERCGSDALLALAWPLTYPVEIKEPLLRHLVHQLWLCDFLGESQYLRSPYGIAFQKALIPPGFDIRGALVFLITLQMDSLRETLDELGAYLDQPVLAAA